MKTEPKIALNFAEIDYSEYAEDVEYYEEDNAGYGVCIHDRELFCDASCIGCKYGVNV